jgi:catechol 2,3-dioxygenase-like lactoylglutathione lyase family enzyme
MSAEEHDPLVRGIAWLGTRTERFAEMVAFARDVLGLPPEHRGTDNVAFTLPDGDQFEVFAPDDGGRPPFDAPVGGFRVDDIEAARAELEANGVDFLNPTERYKGVAWTHFRAPDGHVYEITSRPTPGTEQRGSATAKRPQPPRSADQRKSDTLALLAREVDCWVASADEHGEPYLVPLSYAWDGERLTLATPLTSRTARNLRRSGRTRVTLGPTRDVVILDGSVEFVSLSADEALADHFAAETGFDARTEPQEYVYLRLTPHRIQAWREANELSGRDLMRDGRWLV